MKFTLKTVVAAALAAGLLGPSAFSQGLEDVEKKLSAILAKAEEKNRFVGLSVLVIDKDKGSFKRHYGFRDHARTLAPDDDTMYEIGSITKVFARLALAAQDKIKPDDLLSQHLPEGIRAPRPHGEDITIKQLMTHTGSFRWSVPCTLRAKDPEKPICFGFDLTPGVKDPYSSGSNELTYKYVNEYSYTVEELPDRIAKLGSYWEYSNAGMGLLGNLLGDAHGQSFEQLLQSTILSPLGMNRTKIDMPCEKKDDCINLAQTHSLKADKSDWEPWVLWHFPGIAAAGGLRSSLSDMEKFLNAAMKPDSTSIGSVFKKGMAVLPDVTAEHNANICKEGQEKEKDLCNPVEMTFRYAWAAYPKGALLFHGGATYGSEAMILSTKDQSFGVVVLSNTGHYLANPSFHFADRVAGCVLTLRFSPESKDACSGLLDPP